MDLALWDFSQVWTSQKLGLYLYTYEGGRSYVNISWAAHLLIGQQLGDQGRSVTLAYDWLELEGTFLLVGSQK